MQAQAGAAPTVYSVSDLTAYIRALMESNENLISIWVAGEISNLSRPSSGHIYFTLKDDHASLRCVIWRESARLLRGALSDGMAVEAHGFVSVYEQGGQYQLYVDGIRAAGEGRLYQEFMRLKIALEAEGLFDEERKRLIPPLPKKIGVVSSRTSAAFQDILNTLRSRFPLVEVFLAHTSVQGSNAPAEIVEAITALNQFVSPDVILLARGGGSLEDLWAFNDELVVRAIVGSQAPIISGVGHETDFTLSDFAADVRAPTPTGAAVLSVPDIKELKGDLGDLDLQLTHMMDLFISRQEYSIQDLSGRFERTAPMRPVREGMQRTDELQRRLKNNIDLIFQRRKHQLDSREGMLFALDPMQVLRRGYGLVRDENGHMITSMKQVQLNNHVNIRMHDGEFGADISEIDKNSKESM